MENKSRLAQHMEFSPCTPVGLLAGYWVGMLM